MFLIFFLLSMATKFPIFNDFRVAFPLIESAEFRYRLWLNLFLKYILCNFFHIFGSSHLSSTFLYTSSSSTLLWALFSSKTLSFSTTQSSSASEIPKLFAIKCTTGTLFVLELGNPSRLLKCSWCFEDFNSFLTGLFVKVCWDLKLKSCFGSKYHKQNYEFSKLYSQIKCNILLFQRLKQ